MRLNRNFDRIEDSYLFVEIADRVAGYSAAHPGADVIRLGIGDVTRPLAPCVVEAGKRAVDEMGRSETFRGYSPDSQGYGFLREAISSYYASFGVRVAPGEIHVSDGAKSDCGNMVDMFAPDAVALIPDPVYPVYLDSNLMSGRRVVFADAAEGNGFLPRPDPSVECDVIYLCSPNNPTGAAYDRAGLKEWVDYANAAGAVILFDAAYEAFVTDAGVPRSIFEIEGARTCAVELCSFSKTAGFTGTRCGYTVVPDELCGGRFAAMWKRRQSTKYNGTSYIQQRMAEAAYSPEGVAQCRENISAYQRNAAVISGCLDSLGIFYTGGKNSPYVWMKCPFGMSSWEFFDHLLGNAQVVGTPGAGFGKNGEGYFRLTAFGSEENTARAAERMSALLKAGV